MKSRVLWIYAVVLTAALVAAFARETGLAAGTSTLAAVETGKVVFLVLDLALVWIFAGLAVKAGIFEERGEPVRDATGKRGASRAAPWIPAHRAARIDPSAVLRSD